MISDQARNARAREGMISVLKTSRAIAVTGAGLSVWAGYPTWKGLINSLAEAVRDRRGGEINVDLIVQNNQNPLHCLQKLGAALERRAAFEEFMRTQFRSIPPSDPAALNLFIRLPFRHVLTLNFEESLERAHLAAGLHFGSISSDRRHELVEFIREFDSSGYRRQILHLHGKVSDGQGSLILTEDDYSRLYRDSLFSGVLWTLLASRKLVFFGCGLTDPDFNRVLEDVRRDVSICAGYHYALVGLWPDQNDVAERNRLNDSFLIEPIFYEVTDGPSGQGHAGFLTCVRELAESLDLGSKFAESLIEPQTNLPPTYDLRMLDRLSASFVQRVDPGDPDASN